MMNHFVNETTAKWRTMLVRVLLGACIIAAVLLGSGRNAHAALMHNSNITPGSAYLEFADLFPSVGWLSAQNAALIEQEGSSGTLIDSGDWGSLVLTSAHGLLSNNANPNSLFAEFQFGLGPNALTDLGENYYADQVFIHPDYVNVESGPDMALLYFSEQFTSAAPAELFTGTDTVGAVYDIVGYGIPGTPATGLQAFDGEKRAGQTKTISINSPSAGYLRGRFDQLGFPNFLELGIQGTPGDSGGAWFLNGLLAGITSDASSPRYGGNTTASRVSLELNWIDEVKAAVQPVPEPASSALLLSGIAILGGMRRRQTRIVERSIP